jgi:hypothetical protein
MHNPVELFPIMNDYSYLINKCKIRIRLLLLLLPDATVCLQAHGDSRMGCVYSTGNAFTPATAVTGLRTSMQ